MRRVRIASSRPARWALTLAAACGAAGTGCRATEQSEAPIAHAPVVAAAVTPVNLGKTLRVGWMGMDGHVGEGPGGDRGNPIYKVVQWNPFAEGLGNVPAIIARADTFDILLIAVTAGSPNTYGAGTAFSITSYIAQLNKLKAIPAFVAAAGRGGSSATSATSPI